MLNSMPPSAVSSGSGMPPSVRRGQQPVSAAMGMVGSGPAMERLRTQLRRIGPHFRMVLLSGETGTGKELAARALHSFGSSVERPFVVCDANWGGAGSPGLREGEQRTLEPVDDLLLTTPQGTLLLDQVGDIPMAAQATLLHRLERWERALRSPTRRERLAARIIASTSQDLRALMKAGRFREELYYRIAMVEIVLPPLREHREDLAELTEFFVRRYAQGLGRPAKAVSTAAMDRLLRHEWPGNVRELKNVLRSAVVGCPGFVIEPHHLSLKDAAAAEMGTLPFETRSGVKLQEVVEQHVQQVLRACAGNKVRAAEILGISRSTLYRMLEGGVACLPGRSA